MVDATEVRNGIQVPIGYAAQMKPRGFKDPEFRKACIRDLIKESEGEEISLNEFAMATYGDIKARGQVGRVIKKLRKERRITRTPSPSNGRKGHHFTYTWHEQRVKPPEYLGPKIQVPELVLPDAPPLP